MGKLSQANIEIFKELLVASLGENTPYQATLNFLDQKLKGLISEEQKVQVLTNVLTTITTQFTIQAMESSRSLSLEDLLFEKKMELLQKDIEKAAVQIGLMEKDIEKSAVQIGLMEKDIEKAPVQIRLMETEIEKARAQIELANGEIAFNQARTALVNAQTESEGEKKKNIVREREAMNDQLRIKEAEFLSNVNFGYAAGGVPVPEKLQETMINAVNKITPEGI